MKYKAIIFDFDYTLGDSTNGIVLSTNHGLEYLGYGKAELFDIKKTIGFTMKNSYKALTKDDIEDNAIIFAQKFIEKADDIMLENTYMLPYVEDVLKNLKEMGIKTGIVTTKFHYRIDQILNKFNITADIDMVIGADDVKVEKPDPEGLNAMISKMKLLKEDVLYIGDSIVDAETAKRADVDFVAVTTGATSKEEFENHVCVDIISDMSKLNYIKY